MVRTTTLAEKDVFQTPLPHRPLQRVRSTLLVASYGMVQRLGRGDDYLRALPRELHPTILGSVAGTWVSADAAMAHYVACEALGLSSEEQFAVGLKVGAQIRGTLFGTLMYLTKEAGATPWSVFPSVPRFWPRLFDGGTVVISKRGPKDAHLDIEGVPLIDIPYFRNAVRGQITGMLHLVCTRAYVTSRPRARGEHQQSGTHAFTIQWV